MHDNDGIGIDLNSDGVTLNGSRTGSGPNNWQHFPVLSATQVDGSGNLLVTYSVDSTTASSTYPLTVDFYATDAFGEGRMYLASDTWTMADLARGGPRARGLDEPQGWQRPYALDSRTASLGRGGLGVI
jgi:hypothetical protein